MKKPNKPIEVVAYDPQWPHLFDQESKVIKNALGAHCLKLYHIGSTSIEGMQAKPKIDILCIVDQLSSSLILKESDYTFKNELNIPLRYYFSKKTGMNKYNLHVVEKGHGFIQLNLAFKNYILEHPEAFNEYAKLKSDLLQNPDSHLKKVDIFSGYNLGKDRFIKKILNKSSFDNYHVCFCMHKGECDSYKHLLKQIPAPSLDPNRDDYHFILYKGSEIVCAAHLKRLNPKEAILQSMHAKDEDDAHKQYLTAFIKKWGFNKGITVK